MIVTTTDKKQSILKLGKFGCLAVLLVAAGILLLGAKPARAFVHTTGGDGYIPFVYQNKIYNIFHHQSPSGDPANPHYDINCVETATEATCTNYPRYFSSTPGSSGWPGIGTPGTADIYTSTMPQSLIEGSKLFYAAQRNNDNGIGCFDLAAATNCGYFQLGTLPKAGGLFIYAGRTDGIERVGNQLFAIGQDLKMYCLDIANPAAPVACAGQPYAVNTGITGQLPITSKSPTPRLLTGGRVYFVMNYAPANSKLTCFDPATHLRCAGWTSLDLPAGDNLSLFEFPDQNGQVSAICAAKAVDDAVHCFSLTNQLAVAPPPNIFSGISTPKPAPAVREEIRVGQKSYFAAMSVAGLGAVSQGFAVCYDFAAQARCSGFGVDGVGRWDGTNGTAINGGETRDYGYFYNSGCLVGLGDAGVLWSFDPVSGKSTGSISNCNPNITPTVPAGLPGAPVVPKGLPNTSLSAKKIAGISLGTLALIGIGLVLRRRKKLSKLL